MEEPKQWVFVDTETTGLDTGRAELLELGMVVVNARTLEPLDERTWYFWPGYGWGADWEPEALRMHQESGLIDRIDDLMRSGVTLSVDRATDEVISFLRMWKAVGSPMCGSTVGSFDRSIIRRLLPVVDFQFHYRCIDVSSIKELVKLWHPHVAKTWEEKIKGRVKPHRAVKDCHYSIEELRFYREHVFQPEKSKDSLLDMPRDVLDPKTYE